MQQRIENAKVLIVNFIINHFYLSGKGRSLCIYSEIKINGSPFYPGPDFL